VINGHFRAVLYKAKKAKQREAGTKRAPTRQATAEGEKTSKGAVRL